MFHTFSQFHITWQDVCLRKKLSLAVSPDDSAIKLPAGATWVDLLFKVPTADFLMPPLPFCSVGRGDTLNKLEINTPCTHHLSILPCKEGPFIRK